MDSGLNVRRAVVMARKLRVEFEGALYHGISRGNYSARVFAEARTKHVFVSRLYEACKRSSWEAARVRSHEQSLPPRGGDAVGKPM